MFIHYSRPLFWLHPALREICNDLHPCICVFTCPLNVLTCSHFAFIAECLVESDLSSSRPVIRQHGYHRCCDERHRPPVDTLDLGDVVPSQHLRSLRNSPHSNTSGRRSPSHNIARFQWSRIRNHLRAHSMAGSIVHESRPEGQGHEQGEEDRNVRGTWVWLLGLISETMGLGDEECLGQLS